MKSLLNGYWIYCTPDLNLLIWFIRVVLISITLSSEAQNLRILHECFKYKTSSPTANTAAVTFVYSTIYLISFARLPSLPAFLYLVVLLAVIKDTVNLEGRNSHFFSMSLYWSHGTAGWLPAFATLEDWGSVQVLGTDGPLSLYLSLYVQSSCGILDWNQSLLLNMVSVARITTYEWWCKCRFRAVWDFSTPRKIIIRYSVPTLLISDLPQQLPRVYRKHIIVGL